MKARDLAWWLQESLISMRRTRRRNVHDHGELF